MILLGIITAVLTGQVPETGDAAIQSAKEAVELCITMLGVMALWCGLMEIAKESGMIAGMTKKMAPVIRFLFPGVPDGHPAHEYLASNIMANILGLGWAATPLGIRAMKELASIQQTSIPPHLHKKKEEKGIASTDMCTFLILNISSLQLIPVNIIAYRTQYGSASPSSIIMPAIAATTVSTLAGVLFSVIARKHSS